MLNAAFLASPNGATLSPAEVDALRAAAKLCNNLVLYLGYLAAAESTALADAAGVSREVLFAVTGALEEINVSTY